jgi:hypothetical protein
MTIINPNHISEIYFEEKDLDILEIQDIKERIATIRRHFFPRLELLMKDSLQCVEQVYGIDSSIGMGNLSSPNNRKDAAKNTGADRVRVGISGKRRDKNQQPLAIKNAKGNDIYIHPAILAFDIYPEGCITVVFSPFSFSVNSSFVAEVSQEIKSNFDLFNTIFTDIGISYNLPDGEYSNDFHDLINIKNFNLSNKSNIRNTPLFFEPCFFPVDFNNHLKQLKTAFVGMYSLLDLFVSIADGKQTRFPEMLNKFYDWYLQEESVNTRDSDNDNLEDFASDLITLVPKEAGEITLKREDLEPELDFDPENILDDDRKRNIIESVQREGQAKFRAELLDVYNKKCAITDCDVEAALDAAHISPYLGPQSNRIANGLLLRSDIHKLFDQYLISINPNTNRIVISSNLLNTCYEELNQKIVNFPQALSFHPSRQVLEWHYNSFLDKQNQ